MIKCAHCPAVIPPLLSSIPLKLCIVELLYCTVVDVLCRALLDINLKSLTLVVGFSLILTGKLNSILASSASVTDPVPSIVVWFALLFPSSS